MSNWRGHLASINKMIPYFNATGHFLYAKSATLYISDMENLKNSMDSETFEKFK